MGRIMRNIEIVGKDCWTLFDTDARNTYVIEEIVSRLLVFELKKPEPVSLGGKVHMVTKDCGLRL